MSNEKIKEYYSEWVNEKTYLLFKRERSGKIFAARASKRGNGIYRNRVLKRFGNLKDSLSNRHNDTDRNNITIAFANLTYSGTGIHEGWESIGADFNRFISAMKKHGLKEFVRVWESQERGACHVHVVLFFDHALSCFRYKGKWRLREKDKFAKLWSHGFSDWSGVDNLARVMNYLIKYLKKSLTLNEETSLTLAKCWVYQKRAFSISRSLFGLVRLDITCITQTGDKPVLLAIGVCEYDLCRLNIVDVVKWDKNTFDIVFDNPMTLEAVLLKS